MASTLAAKVSIACSGPQHPEKYCKCLGTGAYFKTPGAALYLSSFQATASFTKVNDSSPVQRIPPVWTAIIYVMVNERHPV